jgi:ribosome-associated toxin RatA of RatAB toxin-antitoxin module
MKDLEGTAADTVARDRDECFAFLEAVDRYPDWYPDVVRSVEVLERDAGGRPTRVHTKLHVSQGPITKDFDVIMAVVVQRPQSLALTKVSEVPSEQKFDVAWRLRDQAGTRLELNLRATLNVPRFLPVGGIGQSIAQGFISAASRALGSGA